VPVLGSHGRLLPNWVNPTEPPEPGISARRRLR
jgi:hypothetical protein